MVRWIGAAFELAREDHPTNKTDTEWAMVLRSVGLSPLIMATMGLLKRVIDETSTRVPSDPNSAGNILMNELTSNSVIGNAILGKATSISRRSRFIQVLFLPALIGLVLCISGGTDQSSASASTRATGTREFKAGLVLFITMILIAIIFVVPLLGVRVIYSIITVFRPDNNFNETNPNIWYEIGPTTIEEFVITITYIALGFTVSHLAPESFDCNDYYKQQEDLDWNGGPDYQYKPHSYPPPPLPHHQQQVYTPEPAYMPRPARDIRDDYYQNGRW